MNPIIIIPARMAAQRLPGKPMADIEGRPMIVHVLARALEAAVGPVAVACCDSEVADAIRVHGGHAVMTDPDLPSGTDRVHAALRALDPRGEHDIVVNLQGDLPTLPADYLARVLAGLAEPGYDISTLVAPIASDEEAAMASVVKAACGFVGEAQVAPAVYFSRGVVPANDGPLWHHIGVYAWRREALARFVALPPSPLELREKLEQLRALEVGMRIAAVRVEHAPYGVDTHEDLLRARQELAG